MPRELEDYRDNLELLGRLYPGKATLTVEETAQIIGCHKQTIVENNDIPVVKIGRRLAVPVVGLARYLSRH